MKDLISSVQKNGRSNINTVKPKGMNKNLLGVLIFVVVLVIFYWAMPIQKMIAVNTAISQLLETIFDGLSKVKAS